MTEKPKIYSMPTEVTKPVHTIRLKDPIIEDVGVPSASVLTLQFPGALLPEKGDRFRIEVGDRKFDEAIGREIVSFLGARVSDKGVLVLTTHAPFDPAAIASLRRGLWPHFHITKAYHIVDQQYVDRHSADGVEKLTKHFVATWSGSAVAAVRRAAALSPENTISKFNKNAAGWSGDPKSPIYAHHRWMRRIVAELGAPKAGERTLDAGCGAGWVGIEAARLGGDVYAFDPSPEMVKIALENAAAEKVSIKAETGFVEKCPWSEPFQLVLNSGVISFAPDAELYMNALDAMVARGGRLVIGDLNPNSTGMQRRRTTRAIIPIRELNAIPRSTILSMLEKRGYTIEARRFYQLTDPYDRMMHFFASRMGGFGCGFILKKNAAAAARDSDNEAGFDSWLVRARKA